MYLESAASWWITDTNLPHLPRECVRKKGEKAPESTRRRWVRYPKIPRQPSPRAVLCPLTDWWTQLPKTVRKSELCNGKPLQQVGLPSYLIGRAILECYIFVGAGCVRRLSRMAVVSCMTHFSISVVWWWCSQVAATNSRLLPVLSQNGAEDKCKGTQALLQTEFLEN